MQTPRRSPDRVKLAAQAVLEKEYERVSDFFRSDSPAAHQIKTIRRAGIAAGTKRKRARARAENTFDRGGEAGRRFVCRARPEFRGAENGAIDHFPKRSWMEEVGLAETSGLPSDRVFCTGTFNCHLVREFSLIPVKIQQPTGIVEHSANKSTPSGALKGNFFRKAQNEPPRCA